MKRVLMSLSVTYPSNATTKGANNDDCRANSNDGWLLGMEKGKEEGEQRLLDCFCRTVRILNGYNDILDFRRANAGIRATLA